MIDNFLEDFKKTLEIINNKLDILNSEENSQIKILSTTDIMSILNINRNQANDLFRRPDFPKIRGIKSNKVEKTAFKKWLQNKERSEKSERYNE